MHIMKYYVNTHANGISYIYFKSKKVGKNVEKMSTYGFSKLESEFKSHQKRAGSPLPH